MPIEFLFNNRPMQRSMSLEGSVRLRELGLAYHASMTHLQLDSVPSPKLTLSVHSPFSPPSISCSVPAPTGMAFLWLVSEAQLGHFSTETYWSQSIFWWFLFLPEGLRPANFDTVGVADYCCICFILLSNMVRAVFSL